MYNIIFVQAHTVRMMLSSSLLEGKEAIAAAMFLPSSLCLLHCKVIQASSTLEVSVLTNNTLLTNCVDKEIAAALNE